MPLKEETWTATVSASHLDSYVQGNSKQTIARRFLRRLGYHALMMSHKISTLNRITQHTILIITCALVIQTYHCQFYAT